MKKYLFILLLLISHFSFAKNNLEDSIYYKHSFSIRPTDLIIGELKVAYQFHFNNKHSLGLNFMIPYFYLDKYSKQQIPLSFQPGAGWIEPFSLPNTIGLKYIYSKKWEEEFELQTSIGYNYRYINNGNISFGGGDHGSASVGFSQQRKELPIDVIALVKLNKSKKATLNFFVGVGARITKNTTKYFNEDYHTTPGFLYSTFNSSDLKILNDNGLYILPSLHFGFMLSLNFYKL